MSEPFSEQLTAEEAGSEETMHHQPEETGSLALSFDDFTALEERVRRAVELVKQARQARGEAEARATRVEAQINEQSSRLAQLENEINSLRTERDQVRQRVERLLKQLDTLEL